VSGTVAYSWYHFSWILCKVLRELVIVNNKVGDVDVAVVLLHEDVLSNLISEGLLDLAQCKLCRIAYL
jgi:hypothetical protein